MSLALKCGACCVKICSLEGRLREALLPSFFWRNERPRVSVHEINNNNQSHPTQTKAFCDKRTHHKLQQADPKRLRQQVEPGGTTRQLHPWGAGGCAEPGDSHILRPVSSDPLPNQTLKALLRFLRTFRP